MYVSIEIPFLYGALYVVVNFVTTCVEMSPLWVWIKRKCLNKIGQHSRNSSYGGIDLRIYEMEHRIVRPDKC